MTGVHLEVLVEEPSMEAFLLALLPRMIPADVTFKVHPFQGKADLLGKLERRLRGYAEWLPREWRIIVLIDRDNDDCHALKDRLEGIARRAGLATRSSRPTWQVVNRLAIEELEAWYFGDWEAVRAAYPRAPAGVPRQRAYRDPDDISRGTWEAFERVLQRCGYFRGGLAKIDAARKIGQHIKITRSRSKSFAMFDAAVREACL